MTIDIVANYIRHLRNEAVRLGIRVPSVLYTLSGRGPVAEQQVLLTAYHRLLTDAGHAPPPLPHGKQEGSAAVRRPGPPVARGAPPAPRHVPTLTTQPTPLKVEPRAQEQTAARIGALLEQTGLGQIAAATRGKPRDMTARTFALLRSTPLGVRALQLRREQ